MQTHHVFFKKEIVDFFLNIDNKRTAHAVGIISKSSNEFRYICVKRLRYLQVITTKPLQLTKKGELLRDELLEIYRLLNK